MSEVARDIGFADRLRVAHIALSITHTAGLAMASVVLENED